MGIEELLARIDAAYRRYGQTQVQADTHRIEPAEEAAISQFESELGRALPDGYRQFLRSNSVMHPFHGNFECLALGRVAGTWRGMNALLAEGVFDGRVEARMECGNWDSGKLARVWWSRGWVPISEDSCANLYCIDLDPGEAGVAGQIVNMEVQDSQGPYATEYPSFESYLEMHLELLETGKVRVEDGWLEVDRYA